MSKYSTKEKVVKWPCGINTDRVALELVLESGSIDGIRITLLKERIVKYYPVKKGIVLVAYKEAVAFLRKNLVFDKIRGKNSLKNQV